MLNDNPQLLRKRHYVIKIKSFTLFLNLLLGGGLCTAVEVQFTSPPTAVKAGNGVVISFALSAPTDVAVYIENARGDVVRHLAAGVLGKTPPSPFKADTLTQSICWDGKADYGKPATGAPFKVRVAVGLGATYDRAISVNQSSFSFISALGAAADGTLYVAARATGAVWTGPFIVAMNRDGSYKRTVMPFPRSLPKSAVAGITHLELNGHPAPLVSSPGMGLYGNLMFVGGSRLAVTPDGRKMLLLSVLADIYGRGKPQLTLLGTDGSCPTAIAVPADTELGLKGYTDCASVVISPAGDYAYITGVAKANPVPAIYRVPLATLGKWVPFFGEVDTAGKDATHLGGAAASLAMDGQGRLFVADRVNDRILVVGSSDGILLLEFAADKPDFLCLNAKNGDLYVSSRKGGTQVTKYITPDNGASYQKTTTTLLPLQRNDSYSMTLDASGERPILWAGDRTGVLVRLEDDGTMFGKPTMVSVGCFGGSAESYMAINTDRSRGEVFARNGTGGGILARYSEATDKVETVCLPGDLWGGGKGYLAIPHPDGFLYGLRWPYFMLKWDRTGKPVAWDDPIRPTEEEMHFNSSKFTGDYPIKMTAESSFVPVSMTELPHTLGIRESDGHLFAFTFRVRGRVAKCLNEYLPSGKQVNNKPLIWMTSDAVLGPKFDANGNIYVAEVIKPKGWQPPVELHPHLSPTGAKVGEGALQEFSQSFTGSIVKFSSKGGTFDFGDVRVGDLSKRQAANPWDVKLGSIANPFIGEPEIAADLKTVDADYFMGGSVRPAKVTGAEWIHPGIQHVGIYACNCENVNFEVDPFGRVFYPNQQLFHIQVIDTAGNDLVRIGSYGNSESQTAAGKPAIGFAWPVAVGVTRDYLYAGDSINRRMLKLRLTYSVTAGCALP